MERSNGITRVFSPRIIPIRSLSLITRGLTVVCPSRREIHHRSWCWRYIDVAVKPPLGERQVGQRSYSIVLIDVARVPTIHRRMPESDVSQSDLKEESEYQDQLEGSDEVQHIRGEIEGSVKRRATSARVTDVRGG